MPGSTLLTSCEHSSPQQINKLVRALRPARCSPCLRCGAAAAVATGRGNLHPEMCRAQAVVCRRQYPPSLFITPLPCSHPPALTRLAFILASNGFHFRRPAGAGAGNNVTLQLNGSLASISQFSSVNCQVTVHRKCAVIHPDPGSKLADRSQYSTAAKRTTYSVPGWAPWAGRK